MTLEVYEQKHLNTLRKLLPECTVLLRSNGDFPLEGPCKLALYGNGARNTVKGGTGSGEVNSRYFVTIEQGLENAGFILTTKYWMDGYDDVRAEAKKAFVEKVKQQAKQAHMNPVIFGMGAVMPEPEYELPLTGDGDVAIYVLSRISGEGNDREFAPGDILLSETEQRDIHTLCSRHKRFLLVINAGGPVDLSSIPEVENVLLLSQLGVDTGTVLADLLLGKAYPSGKLTTTWASAADQPQIGNFGDRNDTCYGEGIYVGYRYYDSVGKNTQFPFGFGLSYTDFQIAFDRIIIEGETISVSANVTNVGSRPGMEVVQLYVSVPSGKLDQPWQSLAAFEKTKELLPGDSRKLTLSFRLSELASFDAANNAYILEHGDYILRLGNSSTCTVPCAAVVLNDDVTVRTVRPIGGECGFIDWKPDTVRTEELPAAIPEIVVQAADIPCQSVQYDCAHPIDNKIQALTNEELAYLNVGAFNPKMGAMSIIGNASTHVAGAAGETTGMLETKGIPALIMADGPAGLRLSRDYTADEKGAHAIGQTMPETVLDFMPKSMLTITKLLSPKTPKNAQILHQYATAIPIGTAIAQSWNRQLAYTCGDIVGSEMERFGVHLWLAPALNIHRDIRCGRNFEYFSEDPLISGIFAAELTKGVQSHPGCGTTIKHFCANNQETNRYGNNSNVSQRALREIYLRGFGICIEQSHPYALMTSYNLLNGIHTSERQDLTEDYLRCECGFNGIVMTDWLVAGSTSGSGMYPAAKASSIAAAGGDLIMPGGIGDWKDILAGIKNGKLRRNQLLVNGTRVYRICKQLSED